MKLSRQTRFIFCIRVKLHLVCTQMRIKSMITIRIKLLVKIFSHNSNLLNYNISRNKEMNNVYLEKKFHFEYSKLCVEAVFFENKRMTIWFLHIVHTCYCNLKEKQSSYNLTTLVNKITTLRKMLHCKTRITLILRKWVENTKLIWKYYKENE